jgi:hypothetical protein
MNGDRLQIAFTQKDSGQRVVAVGETQTETLADLVAAAPDLKKPENLGRYCDAVNYLARGDEYLPIYEPDAFRAHYERRFQSEDPKAPFEESAPRLRNFGHCDMAEIALPRVEAGSVIFYVEDDFLGIPYRVAAPGPDYPEGEITYDPLPMSPLPE